jgi:hypothetical protein
VYARQLVSSLESKPSSSNTGDTMISGVTPRVGTMRWPIYKPSCYIEPMTVPPPTTPRRGTWGGSQTASVRRRRGGWATRGVCLCVRRPRVHALHYSTWRIWGELLPPPAQVRGDQPCAGTGGCCGVEKGWFRISLFCSEHCRLRCEMVKFAMRIGNQ